MPRDVPPPRPVPAGADSPRRPRRPAWAARPARSPTPSPGLLGGPPGRRRRRADGRPAPRQPGCRDVLGAVAGAVGAAPSRPGGGTPSAAAPAGQGATGRPARCSATCWPPPRPGCRSGTRDRLRRAYPGATDDEIADALVARAARLTAGIGAAAGGLSAAQWFAPPSLLALPAGARCRDRADRRGRGRPRRRAARAVRAARAGRRPHPRRGLPGRAGPRSARSTAPAAAGLGSLLGSAGLRALRRRMTRRLAGARARVPRRSCIGAAIAGRGNRRATETLAERVLADLRALPAGRPRSLSAAAGPSRDDPCRARLGSPSCPRSPPELDVPVRLTAARAPSPRYALPGDAGADLSVAEDVELAPVPARARRHRRGRRHPRGLRRVRASALRAWPTGSG